jgi:hypothetical protein
VQAGPNDVGLLLGFAFEKRHAVKLNCFLSSNYSGRDWDFYLVLVLGPFASDEG